MTKGLKAKQPPGAVKAMVVGAEKNARAIRAAANLAPCDKVYAASLAAALGLTVVAADELLAGSNETLNNQLNALSAKTWSAMVIPSTTVIVINPNQTTERMESSIMEEVAHLFLGHEPSSITSGLSSRVSRSFDSEQERVAYWTGAAVLLPAERLARLVWDQKTVPEIASEFGVSDELVEFRLKILGLWRRAVRENASC